MLEHYKYDYTYVINEIFRQSLQYGILCLKQLNYSKSELETRRLQSQENLNDVFVWSNTRVMKWLNQIGLGEFTQNLKESGIHGAVIALDSNFRGEDLAMQLKLHSSHPVSSLILSIPEFYKTVFFR